MTPEQKKGLFSASSGQGETFRPATSPSTEHPVRRKGCMGGFILLGHVVRFFFRHPKTTLFVILLLIMAFGGYHYLQKSFDLKKLVAVERTTTIEETPIEIRSLRNIGQWEFLSVTAEELREKHDEGMLSSRHLVCIYRGTLRIGIDMERTDENWCHIENRRVVLRLPNVALLDNNFIDEARTTVFYQDGNWSAAERQALCAEAREAMKQRALTAENLSIARRNAEAQFQKIFSALGYEDVSIIFEDTPTTKN